MSMNGTTLSSYNCGIYQYIAGTAQETNGAVQIWIDSFLNYLATDAKIIEIGSAFGRDADYIESVKGFAIERTDASDGFVAYLQESGKSAAHFNILTEDFNSLYDLVFANAVFLHFTRDELKAVLIKVHAHLKDNGFLAFSLKIGDGDEWTTEKVGNPRYFCYWRKESIEALLQSTGFECLDIDEDEKFMRITAKKT